MEKKFNIVRFISISLAVIGMFLLFIIAIIHVLAMMRIIVLNDYQINASTGLFVGSLIICFIACTLDTVKEL